MRDHCDAARHKIPLVVGIIADTVVPMLVARLLDDLLELVETDPGLGRIQVILLENPSVPPDRLSMTSMLNRYRNRGLHVVSVAAVVPDHGAAHSAATGTAAAPERLPIATARTQLQRHCAQAARSLSREPGQVGVWILDEDLRLKPLLEKVRQGVLASAEIAEAKTRGADVVVSPILGAPPLPARSMARVNLEDACRHMELIAHMDPEHSWPDRRRDNQLVRRQISEYYYDYSSAHSDAADWPMWLEPAHPGERVADAFLRLCEGSGGLLHGRPITRDLRCEDGGHLPAPLCRGGNTLVLRVDLLDRFPNLAARIGGRLTRRSDMIWARLACFFGNAQIVRGSLLALQDRLGPAQSDFSAEKLMDDTRGSALVKALDALLQPESYAIERAIDAYSEHMGERIRRIHRSERLVKERIHAMQHWLATDLSRQELWFTKHPTYLLATAKFRQSLEKLLAAYCDSPADPMKANEAELFEVHKFLGQLTAAFGSPGKSRPRAR